MDKTFTIGIDKQDEKTIVILDDIPEEYMVIKKISKYDKKKYTTIKVKLITVKTR